MDEAKLLERMKQKEEAALEELMAEYEPYVRAVVSGILLPYLAKEDVNEVVSDAFYSLWSHIGRIDLSKGSMKAYLTVSARNLARNRFRGYRSEVPLQEADWVETEELYERMAEQEKAAVIREALECLRAEEREILLRYYYLYQNTGEIAERMGLRVNTVKSKLRRGRRKLEGHLRERGICR